MKDHANGGDYKVNALKREVFEEFDNQVSFEKYNFLGEVAAPSINIHFYVYLITEFTGTVPEYTVEDGARFGDLLWIDLAHRNKYFIYDSAFEICDMIDQYEEIERKVR